MSPLSGFLAVIVFFTATLVAYLTKQFQNENLNYSSSNQMKNTNTNTKVKTIEKEKVVAETINGRFAMLGLIAAVGAYLTTCLLYTSPSPRDKRQYRMPSAA